MARLELGNADLSLLSDVPGTRVAIPYLTALTVPFSTDKAFVRFVGDAYPTAFRGEGRNAGYSLSCLYPRGKHADLVALLVLLQETAPAAPDSRLLLRTHGGIAAGLNAATAVEVDGDITQSWTAPAVTVSFTVRVVEHTFIV